MIENIFQDLKNKSTKLAVVGLGYVGLPLAHAFAKHFDVIGFDVNTDKVELMKKGIDPTGEVPENGLKEVNIHFTDKPEMLKECQFIIVAVPTPIDKHKRPNLTPIVMSSTTVGKHMPENSIIVFESTVYPGVTEDECVPLLEKYSGKEYMKQFKVGYSPERINPGDTGHRLTTIMKIVAGCDDETLNTIANVYETIIEPGVHRASSIKVAEAAKVIENTQRDVNIALMNELSMIFHKLNIDTLEVLEAAGTKWNFLKFFPGLVGGHCIGVDPYYLTYKAEEVGYHPQVILSGRRINDNMGKFIAENTVKKLIRVGKPVKGAKVAILGLTFKENVGDIRNTKVVDVIDELEDYGIQTIVFDPHADSKEVKHVYNIDMLDKINRIENADAIILAVNHDKFKDLSLDTIKALCSDDSRPVLMDIKGFFKPKEANKSGFEYWRL